MKIDVTKLIYKYTWFDAEEAAAESKRTRQNLLIENHILKKKKFKFILILLFG